ncbi:NAD(P)-dependent oxidoreductase [Caldicellulosiruptoraceae bacterium PP1]
MPKYFEKNIYLSKLSSISLISQKVKVCIIGGGKAGYLKAKGFVKRGCSVYVVSDKFIDSFNLLKNNDIYFINMQYSEEVIIDKHLIIIAIDNDEKIKEIIEHCNKYSKLYVVCKNAQYGNTIIPMQETFEDFHIAINTLNGNPTFARFLMQRFINNTKKYLDFYKYSQKIREKIKNSNNKELIKTIMNYLNSDKFYEAYTLIRNEDILNED